MKKRVLQSFLLQLIYSGMCRCFLKVSLRVRFDDNKVFNDINQFIIIANHTSHMDTISLLASLPRKIIWKVKPVAAEDYFGKTKLKAWFSNYFINTLLIQRKATKNEKKDPLKKMLKALDDGYSLILYPEGTRKCGGEMKEMKSGIAHILSARPHIGYIPVYLQGMKHILFENKQAKSITFGNISYAQSVYIKEIMEQIRSDFEHLS